MILGLSGRMRASPCLFEAEEGLSEPNGRDEEKMDLDVEASEGSSVLSFVYAGN